jgi:hypothetical protein
MSAGSLPSEPFEAPQGERAQSRPPEKPPVRRPPIAWETIATLLPPGVESRTDLAGLFRFDPPTPAQYTVPRTFGMSAILGIMTALAVLFAGFRIYDAHPVLYLFFGVQVLVICIAQMLYGKTPRFASAASGSLLMPIFLIGWIAFWDRRSSDGALCLLLISVPLGAGLGYITGTMAAGVFLVMDAAEKFLMGAGDEPNRFETTQ